MHLSGRGWERAMQPAALRTVPGDGNDPVPTVHCAGARKPCSLWSLARLAFHPLVLVPLLSRVTSRYMTLPEIETLVWASQAAQW